MAQGGSQRSARIIWGNEESGILLPTSPSKFVRDKTWIMHYEHQALNFTDVTVKAGNKAMALTGLGDEDLKLRTSESLLVRKYRYSTRQILYSPFFPPLGPCTKRFGILLYFFAPPSSDLYPVGNYFFVLTSVDGSKTYKPVGCTVMDIPTAYAFFGLDPGKTCARVTAAVNHLVQSWNQNEAQKSSVSFFYFSHPPPPFQSHPLRLNQIVIALLLLLYDC